MQISPTSTGCVILDVRQQILTVSVFNISGLKFDYVVRLIMSFGPFMGTILAKILLVIFRFVLYFMLNIVSLNLI